MTKAWQTLIAVSSLLLGSEAHAQGRPSAHPYICNTAEIVLGGNDKFVILRKGPGIKFKKSSIKLKSKDVVYICDIVSEWSEIFFKHKDKKCELSRPEVGLDFLERVGCSSGWVRSENLDIISG